MFGADVYNSGSGDDIVYNRAIYGINNAIYKEKSGQSDPKVIEITCEIKSQTGSEEELLYYKYYVTYTTSGKTDPSVEGTWLEHPSAPENKKKPDSVWYPEKQTDVDSFWNGQLNYNTIKSIIPLP